MARRDYPVGRGRPPQHTQFTKGQSGNPAGRPKGSRNIRTAIENELLSAATVREGGRQVKTTKLQVVLKSLISRAAHGDTKAAAVVLDCTYKLDRMAPPQLEQPSAAESLPAADEALLADYLARSREGGGGGQ